MQDNCFCWVVFVMASVPGIWTLKELDFEVYQLRSYWLLCYLEKYLRFLWTHDVSLPRVCFRPFSVLAAMVNQLWLVVPFERLVKCALTLACTFTTADFSSE